jgi:hypothetical protein
MASNPAAQAVLAFVVLSVTALIGLWALGAAVADVGEPSNISTTVQHQNDSYQAVGGTDIDRYAEPTVSNNSGTLNDSEYTWNNSDGTILFNKSYFDTNDPSQTYTNATVNVTGYTLPDQAATIVNALGPLYQLPGWLIFILGPVTILYGLIQLNKATGRRRGPA